MRVYARFTTTTEDSHTINNLIYHNIPNANKWVPHENKQKLRAKYHQLVHFTISNL